MKIENYKDSRHQAHYLSGYQNPQTISWLALRQDKSVKPVYNIIPPSEQRCGELVIENCLKYKHFGVIEHPQITINFVGVPHSVISQITRHRHTTFDIQSFRYTSGSILNVDLGDFSFDCSKLKSSNIESIDTTCQKSIENAIYFRPIGDYQDRQGHHYEYTDQLRFEDISIAASLIRHYQKRININNFSPEHSRGMLPYDYRQHGVLSLNMLSLCHILSLRMKADSQLETQYFAKNVCEIFKFWSPEIYNFFITNTKFRSVGL